MVGIPPVLDSDPEDVAWALQTAEALWKRSERVDAIVWLRRAAQAAGEAEDDDRALVLARGAAELAEWLAQNPQPAAPSASPAPRPVSTAPPTAASAIDDLLRSSQTDEIEVRVSELPVESMSMESIRGEEVPPPPPPPPLPPPAPPPRRSSPAPSRPPLPTPTLADEPLPEGDRGSFVPTAAEKHAGMLDPWAESEAPTREREVETAEATRAPAAFDGDEVVTSAPPVARPPAKKPPRPPPVAAAPPPPPPRQPSPPPPPLPAPGPPPAPAPPPASLPPAPAPPAGALDLSRVDAFADLPDDARAACAAAAIIATLARDEEVSGFALVYVMEGAVDLMATIIEAPARRLEAGAVLRARGTIDHVEPLRLVAASDAARVATWDEAAVEAAFRTCPWVEDDLRAAGDRAQAEVGVTMGPLGERLDPGMRADVLSKLALRVLVENDVYAEQGKPIPGLLVVGAGELELLGEGGTAQGHVRAGEFLFPAEVLRAAPAPATARAGKGGAIVLCAERHAAQELLVTYPPLLEIFAG
jgi:hypothetical protein